MDEELSRRIIASSPDCISTIDLAGRLRSMNECGLAMMEIDDLGQFQGHPWLAFWNGDHAAAARSALETAKTGGIGRFQGSASTLKGNRRWWDVRIVPLNGKDGAPDLLVAVSREMSSEHLAIERSYADLEDRVRDRTSALDKSNDALLDEISQREAAQAQVRQMQKMEAVGQLTGGIAHDFNNMLAVIISGNDLVRRRIARGEHVEKLIDGISDAAHRAAALTNRLLAFSRQLPLTPEIINANRMVGSMSELLRRTLGADTQLETVLAGGLWQTHADIAQLESAIVNLAINARDAMPDGGMLTIETQNTHLDDEYARDNADVTAGQYVLIAVSDTGTGMTPDVLARAFEPFFTTKPVGKGTGLGLSQVFGFIKQSKGHLKLYSEVGKGTAVKIYLPRFYGAEEAIRTEPSRHLAPSGSPSEVILVVEDEPRIREITTEALRELGYSVIHASSGTAALRVLQSRHDIGLLFTDIVMPDMNGRRLADEALKLYPKLRVLFTTGYTRNAVVHNGVLDPGVNFLAKPYTLDVLARKVREALE